MNEFFASIKADLTDRRLVPFVAVVCALLVAALAYALLGGGSSSSSSSIPPVPTVRPPTGIAVTGTTTQKAVAETTDGFTGQSHGVSRDPFAPLPGAETTEASTVSAPVTSSSSSSSSSSESSTSVESPGPSNESGSSSEPTKPKAQPKPKTVYDVTAKFGELPLGTPPEQATLTEYKKLKLQTPLPNSEQPLIVFRGVTARGRAATFTLVSEAILTGTGRCLPSAQQCQAVDLKPGQIEQLNYLMPDGTPVMYELRVLGIEARKASPSAKKAAAASTADGSEEWGVSRVGQELLRKAGLVALPFLRYSSQPGVLVFASKKKKKNDAHDARSARQG